MFKGLQHVVVSERTKTRGRTYKTVTENQVNAGFPSVFPPSFALLPSFSFVHAIFQTESMNERRKKAASRQHTAD